MHITLDAPLLLGAIRHGPMRCSALHLGWPWASAALPACLPQACLAAWRGSHWAAPRLPQPAVPAVRLQGVELRQDPLPGCAGAGDLFR